MPGDSAETLDDLRQECAVLRQQKARSVRQRGRRRSVVGGVREGTVPARWWDMSHGAGESDLVRRWGRP